MKRGGGKKESSRTMQWLNISTHRILVDCLTYRRLFTFWLVYFLLTFWPVDFFSTFLPQWTRAGMATLAALNVAVRPLLYNNRIHIIYNILPFTYLIWYVPKYVLHGHTKTIITLKAYDVILHMHVSTYDHSMTFGYHDDINIWKSWCHYDDVIITITSPQWNHHDDIIMWRRVGWRGIRFGTTLMLCPRFWTMTWRHLRLVRASSTQRQ